MCLSVAQLGHEVDLFCSGSFTLGQLLCSFLLLVMGNDTRHFGKLNIVKACGKSSHMGTVDVIIY